VCGAGCRNPCPVWVLFPYFVRYPPARSGVARSPLNARRPNDS
jgi:hypothetical protein